MPSLPSSDSTSAASSAKGYAVLLPGRLAWPVICHREPLQCPTCMQRIAEFLAREIDHDLQAALDRPVAQYQAEVCGELEHGHELRRLTVLACAVHQKKARWGSLPLVSDTLIADDLVKSPAARIEVAA